MLSTTFIIDEKGKKISAVMPIKKYEQLLEELEELEDIKAYDKVMGRKKEFIPFQQALQEAEVTYKTARKKKK